MFYTFSIFGIKANASLTTTTTATNEEKRRKEQKKNVSIKFIGGTIACILSNMLVVLYIMRPNIYKLRKCFKREKMKRKFQAMLK